MRILPLVLLLSVSGCQSPEERKVSVDDPLFPKEPINAFYKTMLEIPVPEGYTRLVSESGSFDEWLRKIPLKKDKTVYLYNGTVKRNQLAQFAVIDIPVGIKDLQQCADVVMRLRAEYLYSQKKYDEIAFMDYSNKWYRCPVGASRKNFNNYLQNVFGWCGSASLEKQLKPVSNFNDIAAGDVLVQGGFPGHAIMVVDVAINKKGQKIFMLTQGYQPAQDMHVLRNPINEELSPWYEIPGGEDIITPEWRFKKKNLENW